IDGYAPPPASASLRVQRIAAAGGSHVQPAPATACTVSPVGIASVTVTVPRLGALAAVRTSNVYVTVWAGALIPANDFAIARSGDATVRSAWLVALSIGKPSVSASASTRPWLPMTVPSGTSGFTRTR